MAPSDMECMRGIGDGGVRVGRSEGGFFGIVGTSRVWGRGGGEGR